ncbi:S-layer homology domain-containing protein [Paenibacillus lutimineralis]|uniref:S-layer homology domain-containing protein n=1 Tax=Paenibacillus lutimineralis TaxID=2707005 RepID=A0A3S9V607_9BACL|nr:S-layer homology domain-containing protein [Paenibacillus lutimineralis]AZS17949.1 S-layer homology domain-containing protein [Paenibacillus lutimineralis]
MNKKLFIWFTALTIGLTSTVSMGGSVFAANTSADFIDLQGLDGAKRAKIDALIQAGIINGVSSTNFGLQEEMNRAQFAKVAALIFNLPVNPNQQQSSFSDVRSDDLANGYALPYIEAVRAAGITDGVGGGQFNPAGQVTKEQLAAFLIRGLGRDGQAQSTPGSGDQTVSDWAQGYVQMSLQLGLLQNAPDGTFGGTAGASRELLATSSFESAKTFEAAQPLEVSGTNFAAGNKLELTMTAGIDPSSIDLSKILVNGVPLDPKLDSYELSEDKKTIIIKLHQGYKLDSSKTPIIVVSGLKTSFGNEIKNDSNKPIPVKLTEPPVAPQVPASTPSTFSPSPSTPSVPSTPTPDVTLTIHVSNAEITQTSASFPITGSVTGSVYYSVLLSDMGAPNLDEIKLGTNAVVHGSVDLDGTKGDLNLQGLLPGTSYILYAYEFANNKTSTISKVSFQTLAEQQNGPTITFDEFETIRTQGDISDTIHAGVYTGEYNRLYYVLTEFPSVFPSVEQVQSGKDGAGVNAIQQGIIEIETASQRADIHIYENLLPSKTYCLYIVGSKGDLYSQVVGLIFERTDLANETFTN